MPKQESLLIKSHRSIGEVEGVLFVVFTMEEGPDWKATRIISARAADEDEVKAYFDWKYGS